MKKQLIFGLVACCSLVLLCFTCRDYIANLVVNTIIDRTAERRALPVEGRYICAECDVTVLFCDREVTLIYGHNEQEQVNVDYGNNLVGTVTELRASIRWAQKNDRVILDIKQGNRYLLSDSRHCFIKTGDDSVP